jgi:hypothetical protein
MGSMGCVRGDRLGWSKIAGEFAVEELGVGGQEHGTLNLELRTLNLEL